MITHRPHIMYHPAREVTALATHGQSWQGETIEENIDLCKFQTIEPVLLHYLPHTGKVIESGCGLGRWVFYLRRTGFDIVGIDLAEDALDAAKAHDPTIPVFRDDVLRSSFPDGSFNAAISLGVVEHFEEGPQEALTELRRLLSSGGILCISVPTQNLLRLLVTNHLKTLYRWLRTLRGERFVFEEYRYSRSAFSALLREAGFTIVTMVPDDFCPPKNIGLYVDFPFFRHRHRKWHLNVAGNFLRMIMNAVSPWWTCAGTFWVCRKAD
jgi:SAM-dependent methyltransferase